MVRFAQQCEEAGFWGCGYNDSQMYYRDTYVVMAAVLAATQQLVVHPALTSPGLRHTSVLASLAKTLQEIGADRFELWLGRGQAAPQKVGLEPLRLSALRAAVEEVRRVMAGEWDVYGVHSHLYMGGEPTVPIFLAGHGPRSIRLAGELGDGVFLGVPLTREGLAQGRAWLAEGAASAGRDPAGIEEVIEVRCVVRDTKEEARRVWSPMLLPILASPDIDEWLAARGIDYDVTDLKPHVARVMAEASQMDPSLMHTDDWERAMTLADVIPADLRAMMTDATAIAGEPDFVLARLRQLEEWGATRVYLSSVLTFQPSEEERRAFQEVIGPGLRESAMREEVSR